MVSGVVLVGVRGRVRGRDNGVVCMGVRECVQWWGRGVVRVVV